MLVVVIVVVLVLVLVVVLVVMLVGASGSASGRAGPTGLRTTATAAQTSFPCQCRRRVIPSGTIVSWWIANKDGHARSSTDLWVGSVESCDGNRNDRPNKFQGFMTHPTTVVVYK